MNSNNTNLFLSLVIPCFNEEENLRNDIDFHRSSVNKYLNENNYEIIFVDDFSNDNTLNLLEEYESNYKNIKVIKNNHNLGVGYSLDKGFQASSSKYVMHNSADLAYRYENFDEIVNYCNKDYDLIILDRGKRTANTFWRKMTSYTWNKLVKVILNLNFNDMNFIQIYKTSLIRKINKKNFTPAGYTVEYIYKISKQNAKIIVLNRIFCKRIRGKANYGKFKDIFISLLGLILLFFDK